MGKEVLGGRRRLDVGQQLPDGEEEQGRKMNQGCCNQIQTDNHNIMKFVILSRRKR